MLQPNRIIELNQTQEGLSLKLDVGSLLIRPQSQHAVRISMKFGDEEPLGYGQPKPNCEIVADLLNGWPTHLSAQQSAGETISLTLGEYQRY